MEHIQQILLDSVSGGFMRFIGYWFIITTILIIPLKLITIIIGAIIRHRIIMKHGYPPKYCDSNGELKKEK
jgi:hypothetical protein